MAQLLDAARNGNASELCRLLQAGSEDVNWTNQVTPSTALLFPPPLLIDASPTFSLNDLQLRCCLLSALATPPEHLPASRLIDALGGTHLCPQ
jgi:hypothetical protein